MLLQPKDSKHKERLHWETHTPEQHLDWNCIIRVIHTIVACTVDWEIFICKNLSVKFSSSYIFVARVHWRKLNAPKMSLCDKPVELHMCKRHMELMCCLSRVRKTAIYDGLEDNRWVSCTAAEPSSLRPLVTVREASIIQLCNYSELKNFCASNFCHCRLLMKYF